MSARVHIIPWLAEWLFRAKIPKMHRNLLPRLTRDPHGSGLYLHMAIAAPHPLGPSSMNFSLVASDHFGLRLVIDYECKAQSPTPTDVRIENVDTLACMQHGRGILRENGEQPGISYCDSRHVRRWAARELVCHRVVVVIGADAAAKISGARRGVWDHDGDVKYPKTHRWYRGEAIKLACAR
jgi:hypothetical protein